MNPQPRQGGSQWCPSDAGERMYYDQLYPLADPSQQGYITGANAVQFFTRSGLDKSILRQVWELADANHSGILQRNDFYVAMRLLAMAQNGYSETLSHQQFQQCQQISNFPLPQLQGVPLSSPQLPVALGNRSSHQQYPAHQQQQQPQQHQHQPQHQYQQYQQQPQHQQQTQYQQQYQQQHQQQPQHQQQQQQQIQMNMLPAQYQVPPTLSTPSSSSYAMTPSEQSSYEVIFQQNDTDRDGYIVGKEAVNFFLKSGLDRTVLRSIWTLADTTKDSRLDVKEFCIAMHLIVCVSKRGMQVPSVLPPEIVQPTSSSTNAPHQQQQPSQIKKGDFDAFSSISSSISRNSSISLSPISISKGFTANSGEATMEVSSLTVKHHDQDIAGSLTSPVAVGLSKVPVNQAMPVNHLSTSATATPSDFRNSMPNISVPISLDYPPVSSHHLQPQGESLNNTNTSVPADTDGTESFRNSMQSNLMMAIPGSSPISVASASPPMNIVNRKQHSDSDPGLDFSMPTTSERTKKDHRYEDELKACKDLGKQIDQSTSATSSTRSSLSYIEKQLEETIETFQTICQLCDKLTKVCLQRSSLQVQISKLNEKKAKKQNPQPSSINPAVVQQLENLVRNEKKDTMTLEHELKQLQEDLRMAESSESSPSPLKKTTVPLGVTNSSNRNSTLDFRNATFDPFSDFDDSSFGNFESLS